MKLSNNKEFKLKCRQNGEWLELAPVIRGKWLFWEGWVSNFDMRIDDAVCSICGYEHQTVCRTCGSKETAQDVLNKLSNYCANCGAKMTYK